MNDIPVYVPDWCKIATRNSGAHSWKCCTHWWITVAGQTINVGPKPTYLNYDKK